MRKLSVCILVAPLLYLVAYAAMVQQIVSITTYPPFSAVVRVEPTYRYGGGLARVFFWPANQIDRLVRSRVWTEKCTRP